MLGVERVIQAILEDAQVISEALLFKELLGVHIVYFFNGLEVRRVVEGVAREVELALAAIYSICIEILHCVHFDVAFLVAGMRQGSRTITTCTLWTSFCIFLGF